MDSLDDERQTTWSDLSDMELSRLILDNIDTFCTDNVKRIALHSLQDMLYTKNLQLLTLHYRRLNTILEGLAAHEGVHEQAMQESIKQLNALFVSREQYLYRWYSYLQFWSSKQWPHLNLLFLIVPLVVGVFVPFVGISMLIFLSIYTGISIIDSGVQGESYWQWQDTPAEHEPGIPTDAENTVSAIQPLETDAIPPPSKDALTRRLDTVLYYGDVIAIAICIIGLISLAFPPIGIPVLAISLLTALAITIGVVQWAIMYREIAKEKSQQEFLENDIARLTTHFTANNTLSQHLGQWFKPTCMPTITLSTAVAQTHPPYNHHATWLDDPLTWYHAPNPQNTPSTSIFEWILNMTKWQLAAAPRELDVLSDRDTAIKKTHSDEDEDRDGRQEEADTTLHS